MSRDKVNTHTCPTPKTAGNEIVNGMTGSKLVSIFGSCEVDYDGRAKSYLPTGDREIQIKPDGTVLVHSTENRKPRNWQPPGATVNVEVPDDDTLVIEARRSAPNTSGDEHLTVYFDSVHHLVIYNARDDAELELTGTEEEMHNRIMNNPSLIEEQFRALEHERSVEFGSIDVFGNDGEGRPVVVEVKRRRAQLKDVDQLARYISLYRDGDADNDDGYTIDELRDQARGVLVAPSASDSVESALEDKGLEFVSLKPAKNLDEAAERSKLTDF